MRPKHLRVRIVQCKRYAPDAFVRHLGDLKKKELPKVKALKPQRYILCTACKLSVASRRLQVALLGSRRSRSMVPLV